MGRIPGTIEFCVLSKTDNVRLIGSWIKAFGERREISSDVLEEAIIVTDEAVTNIILHAYQGRDDGLIEVRCRVEGRSLELRIKDGGCAFTPPCVKSLANKKKEDYLTKGGYGLIIMHRLMKEVRFERDEVAGKNILLMYKDF